MQDFLELVSLSQFNFNYEFIKYRKYCLVLMLDENTYKLILSILLQALAMGAVQPSPSELMIWTM